MGVLVQRMVPAVVSGVAFTTNPVTGADEIVVNAAWGLGEALVSGRVDPDEFILRKDDGSVVSSRRGAQDGSPARPRAGPRSMPRSSPRWDRCSLEHRAPLRRAAGRRVVPRRPRSSGSCNRGRSRQSPVIRHPSSVNSRQSRPRLRVPSPSRERPVPSRCPVDAREPCRSLAGAHLAAGAGGARGDVERRRAPSTWDG